MTGRTRCATTRLAKPGVSNLLELLASVQGRRPEDVAGEYTRYGPLKADVADAVISVVEPIQLAYRELGFRSRGGHQGAQRRRRACRRDRAEDSEPGLGGDGPARPALEPSRAAAVSGHRISGVTWCSGSPGAWVTWCLGHLVRGHLVRGHLATGGDQAKTSLE